MTEPFDQEIISPTPTSDHVPVESIDATTGMPMSEWELSDEWTFTVEVPSTYSTGTDLALRLQEASPSTSLNHKWQAAVSLLRPSTNGTDSVTVTQQYLSSETAEFLFTRQFNLTSSGNVDTTAVAAGDLITVVLTRIAASADEDPEDIKLFKTWVRTTVTALTNLCSWRVAEIINDVRTIFNDTEGELLFDVDMVRLINNCKEDLARAGYWPIKTYLDYEANVATYDLLTLCPDFVDLIKFIDPTTGVAVTRCESIQEFEYRKANYTETTTSEFYVVYGNTLEVYPVPTANETDARTLYYASTRDDVGCTASYTPPWPRAYDNLVAVTYCLWKAFEVGRGTGYSQKKAAEYQALYEKEKRSLLGQSKGPQHFKPYR